MDVVRAASFTANNESSHLSCTGLPGTRGCLRRAVAASCCALCGDSKYIFPQQTRQHKQGHKRKSPSAEQPTGTFQDSHDMENPDTKPSEKIIEPKVTLCDLAPYCDTCSHNCGFVLPDVVKTKVLRCFKKDIAGFRFGPRCLRHNKPKIEEAALAKNTEVVPRYCLRNRVSQPQSLTDHQRMMTDHPETETLSCCSTTSFCKGWTGQASATCTNQLGCRTNLWDRADEDSGPGEETCEEKRTSIGESSGSIVPNTSDLEGNCVHKKHSGELDEPRKNYAVQMSPELLDQRSEMDTNSSESFTCQRVRPFIRKMQFSCARTYKPWPFSNSGRDLGSHVDTPACPADSSPVQQPSTLNSQTTDKLLNAPTDPPSDTTQLISHRSEEKQDENAKSSLNERNLEQFYKTSPFNREHSIPKENCVESNSKELMLLPLLSPVTSPQPSSRSSFLPAPQEEMNEDPSKPKILLEHHLLKCLEHRYEESDDISTPSTAREEESSDHAEYEDDVQEGNRSSDEAPLDLKAKTTHTEAVVTEPHSSTSSEEDGEGVMTDEDPPPHFAGDEGSSPPEVTDKERETAAGDCQPSDLDEFTAYEHDILLVSVTQDDPELFENLPEQNVLKLVPTGVSDERETTSAGSQRLTPVNLNFPRGSSDITEDSYNRPWRPQYSSITSKAPKAFPKNNKEARDVGQSDVNNNHVSRGVERIQTVNSSLKKSKIIPSLLMIRDGPSITNTAEFRHHKSNAYCRQYFSESPSCGFKMCWFQHVPLDGDEKFCIETVQRFTKTPMCLHKAGAVFAGYYNKNSPGVHFSKPVLVALLWALLKAGMVVDVFSVLSVSVAHMIVPSLEFLLALFNFVKEKGLMSFVPELMQLTFKMSSAGLLECLDTVQPASPASVLSNGAPISEYLTLAHSIVEIELCTKQENWRRMGEVFKSICQFSQHPNQVERISARIAVALLSESKDKLSLPFAAFAETVCQNESEDSLIRSFVGRIGVSLMLRYHKTHQWAKGQRVVEVLLMSKVNYSTLKGLFGNEDEASRCRLVTVAAELFLLTGSVEGALKTLRENEWFLTSFAWPCAPSDLDSRNSVMMRLAKNTSHRDTLEVLCNLPGIKEVTDIIDVARYSSLFSFHLQVCVERQVLPVAADTVDFMMSKKLPVDHKVLQTLLHKLDSLSVGYYSALSAPAGFMSLIVPCQLGEVELALTFEMFITLNAAVILQLTEKSTSSLSITLKRTQSCENAYLAAGSRLLSAASIPQPKLTVHYIAVNASQEQLFALDISSAKRWLRHNHLWANEVWLQ